jgi:hypothetical protein
MSSRPSYPSAGSSQSQPPPNSQTKLSPPMYDQSTRVYYGAPPAAYSRSQPYATSQLYYYPSPYNTGKPGYPQEQIMVIHPQAEPVYPVARPPPPPASSFQRLAIPAQPSAPPPRAPLKMHEGKRARMTQPSVNGPSKMKPQLPPQPPIVMKPPVEDFRIQLSPTPEFMPDHRSPPGCFDIVGRGTFPRISFATHVEV